MQKDLRVDALEKIDNGFPSTLRKTQVSKLNKISNVS